MALTSKFSIAMPVEVVASGGILVRQVDTNGASLDDPTTIYSVAIPVMPVTSAGINEDSSLTFSEHRLITISPNGIPVVRVGADGTSVNTSLSGPTLGPELVTNGGFDTTSNWDLSGGTATISGGLLNCNQVGSVALAIQAIAFTAGLTYRITYTIVSYTSGVIQAEYQQGSNVFGTQRSAAGTYTEDLVAGTGNGFLRLNCTGAGFVGTVDNVSIKKVG